jgi:hypothetical protein
MLIPRSRLLTSPQQKIIWSFSRDAWDPTSVTMYGRTLERFLRLMKILGLRRFRKSSPIVRISARQFAFGEPGKSFGSLVFTFSLTPQFRRDSITQFGVIPAQRNRAGSPPPNIFRLSQRLTPPLFALDSLDRLQQRLLTGTSTEIRALWNESSGSVSETPKDEEALSEVVCQWLRDDLGPKSGLILNGAVKKGSVNKS